MQKPNLGVRATPIVRPAVHVIVIEERHKFREGIRKLIDGTPGYQYVGAFQSMAEALSKIPTSDLNLVLIEIRDLSRSEHSSCKLTRHEARILQLLVQGHNYKTAASELQVSVNTVSFHMRRIYEKLGVHSKSEAVAKALRHGWFN